MQFNISSQQNNSSWSLLTSGFSNFGPSDYGQISDAKPLEVVHA